MKIAIDFDDTFTQDPAGWTEFIQLMSKRGHSFICVTGRSANTAMAHEVVSVMKDLMPIIFCGMDCKREATEKAGVKIDVWIDDCPEMIVKPVHLF